MRNSIEFKVRGRYALFTDPLTRVGGEKCSYHIPTYEALKGVVKSIYWKPTIVWIVDEVRVMKRIRTQTKGVKVPKFNGSNDLSYYTYLHDVEYQVRAHFEWNTQHESLKNDRNEGKHFNIATRMVERGGRHDVFLGTRECQSYVEPCVFGDGTGEYDGYGSLDFGLMFHGFDYPEETGKHELRTRFWMPKMENGIIKFPRPEECVVNKFVRVMPKREYEIGVNMESVEVTSQETGL